MSRLVCLVLLACVVGCGVDQSRFAFHPIPAGRLVTGGIEITAEDNSFRFLTGQSFTSPFSLGDRCPLDPTAENAGDGLANGARPVTVKLADGRQLYGLLALCGAPTGASGPATRSYEIQVPEDYIAATSGGRVSVVFEPFTSSNIHAKAWILWLSETSLSRERAIGSDTAKSRADYVMEEGGGLKFAAKMCALIGLGVAGVGALLVPEVGIPAIPVAVLGATSLLIIAPMFYVSGVKKQNLAADQYSQRDTPLDPVPGIGIAGRF